MARFKFNRKKETPQQYHARRKREGILLIVMLSIGFLGYIINWLFQLLYGNTLL